MQGFYVISAFSNTWNKKISHQLIGQPGDVAAILN